MMRGVRIGAIGDPGTSAISYRAFSPVDALGRRGHDAVLPNPTTGMLSLPTRRRAMRSWSSAATTRPASS